MSGAGVTPHLTIVACGPLLLGAGLAAGEARACSPQYQGIAERTTFPTDGAAGVPLNARVLVRYHVGYPDTPHFGVPLPGPDLELRPQGGASVSFAHGIVFSRQNDSIAQAVVVIRPAQPLQPSTVYELADRRSKIPCLRYECALGDAAVFARFTTGVATDTTSPQFAGLKTIDTGEIRHCDQEGCCGEYLSRTLPAGWEPARDDISAGAVIYNLYRQGQSAPVAELLESISLRLMVSCAPFGRTDPSGLRVEAGAYYVRASDWAGNEDTNELAIALPSANCAVAAPDGGEPDAGVEAPGATDTVSVSEVGADLVGDGQADTGLLPDGAAVREAGAEQPGAASPKRSAGGGCAMGGQASPGAGLCLILMLTAARRLFRSRRSATLRRSL